MNKTIRTIAMTAILLCGVSMQALAEAVSDTLVIRDVDKVRIETRDTLQRIVINGAKDDSDFRYEQTIAIPDTNAVHRKFKSKRDIKRFRFFPKKSTGGKGDVDGSFHLFVGLGTMLELREDALQGAAPQDYSFKIWPSVEVGFCLTADWSPFGPKNIWSIGFGLDWRSFASSTDSYWVKNLKGTMKQVPYPSTQSDTYTSLSLFSLQVPVLYTHCFDTDGDWKVTLGGIVNFNTGAHATRRYQEGGEDFEVKTGSIGQRPVTIDALVMFDMPSFPAIYCKYSPMSFFKKGKGPQLHMINFGFCF